MITLSKYCRFVVNLSLDSEVIKCFPFSKKQFELSETTSACTISVLQKSVKIGLQDIHVFKHFYMKLQLLCHISSTWRTKRNSGLGIKGTRTVTRRRTPNQKYRYEEVSSSTLSSLSAFLLINNDMKWTC